MVGMYVFTDPAKDSREKLTWSALGEHGLYNFECLRVNKLFHSERPCSP